MRRDAGCTIVQPSRGDRQGAWGMGLPWQLEGAHMTSNTKVSRGGTARGSGERSLICSHGRGTSWRSRSWTARALTSGSSSGSCSIREGARQCGEAVITRIIFSGQIDSFVCVSCYTCQDKRPSPCKKNANIWNSFQFGAQGRREITSQIFVAPNKSSTRSYHLWEEATQRSGQSPSGPKGQLLISPSTACHASCRGASHPQPFT